MNRLEKPDTAPPSRKLGKTFGYYRRYKRVGLSQQQTREYWAQYDNLGKFHDTDHSLEELLDARSGLMFRNNETYKEWLKSLSANDNKILEINYVFRKEQLRRSYGNSTCDGDGKIWPYLPLKIRRGLCEICSIEYRYLHERSGITLTRGVCSACRKVVGPRMKIYANGVSEIEKQKLIDYQDNCCILCQEEFDFRDWKKSPVVDHDHLTLRTRGILCNGCNLAVGFIKDNSETAERMVDYLRD